MLEAHISKLQRTDYAEHRILEMVKNEIEVNSLEEDLTLATAEMRLAFKEINKNENEIK